MSVSVSASEQALDTVKAVIASDNGRDAAGYRALIHDDYVARVHGQVTVDNAEDEVAALERWWAACSDVHLEPNAFHVDGNVVTLLYTLSGTNDGDFFGQPATGRRFDVHNCTVLEVKDRKVSRVWRYADTQGLVTQLGLGS